MNILIDDKKLGYPAAIRLLESLLEQARSLWNISEGRSGFAKYQRVLDQVATVDGAVRDEESAFARQQAIQRLVEDLYAVQGGLTDQSLRNRARIEVEHLTVVHGVTQRASQRNARLEIDRLN